MFGELSWSSSKSRIRRICVIPCQSVGYSIGPAMSNGFGQRMVLVWLPMPNHSRLDVPVCMCVSVWKERVKRERGSCTPLPTLPLWYCYPADLLGFFFLDSRLIVKGMTRKRAKFLSTAIYWSAKLEMPTQSAMSATAEENGRLCLPEMGPLLGKR